MRGTQRPLDVPLRAPFRIASGELTSAHNVLYTVEAEGLAGCGEATPFEAVTGGTQERARWDLSSVPEEFPFSGEEDVVDALMRLEASRLGPDARNALDVALHDWLAQARRVSLAKLLGGRVRSFPTSITIPIVGLDEVERRVRAAMDHGFTVFKVKSQAGAETEARRIRLVRDLVGASAEIRVDANEGWSLLEAKRLLPVLRSAEVAFVEQPLKRSDLAGHAELVRTGGVPVMLDESVFGLEDARRAVAARALNLLNVKLGKTGGIVEAGRVLRYAEVQGIPCMVGCMIETRIGISAGAHVASAFAAVRHVDLDGHTFLSEDPVEGGARIEKGRLVVPDGPGHGARPARLAPARAR